MVAGVEVRDSAEEAVEDEAVVARVITTSRWTMLIQEVNKIRARRLHRGDKLATRRICKIIIRNSVF